MMIMTDLALENRANFINGKTGHIIIKKIDFQVKVKKKKGI